MISSVAPSSEQTIMVCFSLFFYLFSFTLTTQAAEGPTELCSKPAVIEIYKELVNHLVDVVRKIKMATTEVAVRRDIEASFGPAPQGKFAETMSCGGEINSQGEFVWTKGDSGHCREDPRMRYDAEIDARFEAKIKSVREEIKKKSFDDFYKLIVIGGRGTNELEVYKCIINITSLQGIGREMQRIFKLEVMDNGRFYVTDMSETTW